MSSEQKEKGPLYWHKGTNTLLCKPCYDARCLGQDKDEADGSEAKWQPRNLFPLMCDCGCRAHCEDRMDDPNRFPGIWLEPLPEPVPAPAREPQVIDLTTSEDDEQEEEEGEDSDSSMQDDKSSASKPEVIDLTAEDDSGS